MLTGRFEDSKFLMVMELLFLSLISATFVFANKMIADAICEITQIPFDFTLSVTSAGFGYDIIILLLVVEFILAVLFIEKFIPNLIHKIVWVN